MRTFREVAKIWNKENPEETISAGQAARIHHVAMAKIKDLLGEDESVDLREDLKECLTRKDRT